MIKPPSWSWHPNPVKLEGPDAKVKHLGITFLLNNSWDHQGAAVITHIHSLKCLLRPSHHQKHSYQAHKCFKLHYQSFNMALYRSYKGPGGQKLLA